MRRGYKRLVLHRRMLVNLKGGTAIEGVLWDEAPDLIVVKGATLHDPKGSPQTMQVDGEVIIERSRIDFVQVVT